MPETDGMQKQIRVGILAFDGCMSSAVVGMLDAFHLANRWSAGSSPLPAAARASAAHSGARFETRILGASKLIAGSSGITLPTQPLDHRAQLHVAIVPPMVEAVEATLAANAALIAWLVRHAARGGTTASVCAGAFFLARAGLLAGRRATTNPLFAPAFQRAHPDTTLLLERRVVDDGRVLTAGSTTAFLDLAIHLIDRYAGPETAVSTAKALSIDKNSRSQLPYFLPFADKSHEDTIVSALQVWLEDHLTEPLSADAMARRAAMSQRSLNRRFRSATGLAPLAYLHRLRVEAAKRHLETSDLNVQEITARVGYQDARSFSRLFRANTGVSPREYRTRFGCG
jgi:transcriptional regulator GlxA family with amidase domain